MKNETPALSRRSALKCMAYGGAGTLFVLAGGTFTPVDLHSCNFRILPRVLEQFRRQIESRGAGACACSSDRNDTGPTPDVQ